jgi:ABC-type sugar transport system ATPase subunit
MRGIVKRFSGVEVLHGVDLTLDRGEALALLGENGAGKSTLMKILNGDYTRDGGEILLDGKPVDFRSPAEAEAAGIQVIYQELNNAPDLSVAENVLLGHLPRKRGPLGAFTVDWRAAHARAGELLRRMGAEVDPRAPMRSLSIGKQQIVEIAKALAREARILVMDEPTAALTPREVERLFHTISALRAQGVAIIYISHRLDEVEEVAQRIEVLRDGSVAGVVNAQDVSRADIVHLMIGRDLGTVYPARAGEPGEVVLDVRGLGRRRAFEDVSFTVRAGEIVALFGLLGAGHEELTRALFGAEPATSGEVRITGRPVDLSSPRAAKAAGIGLVPQDRKNEGLVLGMGVADNITLGNWDGISRAGILQARRETERAGQWVERLGIRARRGIRQEVQTLSGGNQQKVVLARWLEAGVRVLLLAEPTRGVDIGARADIYAALERLRAEGLALILVSTDIEEVCALSDRVLVFAKGRVAREFAREDVTQTALLAAAAGEETQGDR